MSSHSAPAPRRTLPSKPSLAQLRKQAKELLKSYRAGNEAAVAEVERFERSPDPANFALADTQGVPAISRPMANLPTQFSVPWQLGRSSAPLWAEGARDCLNAPPARAVAIVAHTHLPTRFRPDIDPRVHTTGSK
jgi:hypothetical protein